MKKKSRVIARPWARRRRGGYIFRPESLLDALKQGDAAEFKGGVVIGTRNLRALIRGFELPANQVLLIKSNGKLEIENLQLRYIPDPGGKYPRKASYCTNKPKFRHRISLHDRAWLSKDKPPATTVVIRPKLF